MPDCRARILSMTKLRPTIAASDLGRFLLNAGKLEAGL
jgi:hypothetical protein